MKKLNINAASVCILRYDPQFFGEYEHVTINTADATLSCEAYAQLSRQGLILNGASVGIIELTGQPVDIGDAVLDGSVDYSGKLLVGGTLRILNQQALEGVAGIMAKKVIAPLDIRFGCKVTGRQHLHPVGAVVVLENITVDADFVRGPEPGAVVWTTGRIKAMDEAAAATLRQKDITLMGSRLLIAEEVEAAYGACFTADRRTVIPAGYQYIGDDLTLHALNADLFGSKLYIRGDLTVMPDGAEALAELDGIMVTGDATIPFAARAAWKEKGRAGAVTLYKGELWRADGSATVTHAQMEAAKTGGYGYTLMVDGALTFEADVTAEDLDCILAVYYSGAVALPDALIPAFNHKVVRGDGAVTPLRPGKAREPHDSGDTVTINTAGFVHI